jgi:hypothetical protein
MDRASAAPVWSKEEEQRMAERARRERYDALVAMADAEAMAQIDMANEQARLDAVLTPMERNQRLDDAMAARFSRAAGGEGPAFSLDTLFSSDAVLFTRQEKEVMAEMRARMYSNPAHDSPFMARVRDKMGMSRREPLSDSTRGSVRSLTSALGLEADLVAHGDEAALERNAEFVARQAMKAKSPLARYIVKRAIAPLFPHQDIWRPKDWVQMTFAELFSPTYQIQDTYRMNDLLLRLGLAHSHELWPSMRADYLKGGELWKRVVESRSMRAVSSCIGSRQGVPMVVEMVSRMFQYGLEIGWWGIFLTLTDALFPMQHAELKGANRIMLGLTDVEAKCTFLAGLVANVSWEIHGDDRSIVRVDTMLYDLYQDTDIGIEPFELMPVCLVRMASVAIMHDRIGEPSFFTTRMKDVYLNGLKTMPSEKIVWHLRNVALYFTQDGIARYEGYLPIDRSEIGQWHWAHRDQPFGYVWGTNPRHHIDFMALALKRRNQALFKVCVDLFGRIGPDAELDRILAADYGQSRGDEMHDYVQLYRPTIFELSPPQ